VHVPGDDGVVGVAGVVVLRVDLDAVAVGVAQVQVERVRDAVAAGAALDGVRAAERAELVADREDVVLSCVAKATWCMRGPSPPVIGGVVHGGLAAHPRGVDGALLVLDVLRDAEAEVLHDFTARGTSG
jgi:hypothetical protein